ncbi:hypothetical protein B0J18DRAFT_241197 [Chaetomium sp. MPI-SDFR-AT-0129]|nr:hypothetical protein B0J18DRAFT_241197 [Chaetomium sp. MPI-SDFR-AT-0129]
MQLTAFALLAGAIASVTATGTNAQAGARKFSLVALHSGTKIHSSNLSATKNKLFVSLPKDRQDAQCSDNQVHDRATLYVADGELFLYNGEGKEQQKFVVDMSGMGGGNLQYFNAAGGAPSAPLETKGWEINSSNALTFKGANLLACSVPDGSYAVYVYNGNDHPANHKECIPFQASSIIVLHPVACKYSTF